MKHFKCLLLICFLVFLSCCYLGSPPSDRKSPLFLIYENNRVGYMDSQGKTVISPMFDSGGPFNEGLAPAAQGNKWGYIDKKGDFVILPRWAGAGDFVSGVACVKIRKEIASDPVRPNSYSQVEIWGMINRQGERINDLEFEPCFQGLTRNDMPRFTDGRLCVKDSKGYFYLDSHGVKVLGPYLKATPFCEGVAVVVTATNFFIIDPSGKPIQPDVRESYSLRSFSSGMAIIDFYSESFASKSSYVNRLGKLAFQERWSSVYPFSDGFAFVSDDSGERVINSSGVVVAPLPTNHKIYAFKASEGFVVVSKPCFQSACLGYMEMSTGKLVIPAEFVEAGPFKNGLAWVVSQDPPREGYINREGKFVRIFRSPKPPSFQPIE